VPNDFRYKIHDWDDDDVDVGRDIGNGVGHCHGWLGGVGVGVRAGSLGEVCSNEVREVRMVDPLADITEAEITFRDF
jgi:hypothetical protein